MSSRLGFSPSTAQISWEAKLRLLSLSLSLCCSLSVFVLSLLADITRSHDDPANSLICQSPISASKPVATQSRSSKNMDAQTVGRLALLRDEANPDWTLINHISNKNYRKVVFFSHNNTRQNVFRFMRNSLQT